jgi:CRISPR-associated protein Cas1
MRAQLSASIPKQKRLWAALVRAKIQNQAAVLRLCEKSAETQLIAVARRVKSGDSGNLEAYAARIYWQALFGKKFRRNREAPDLNSLLNYGYAIARAAIARAIVGTGLNPGFGVCHRNQYNAFPLADDLVEPIRPFWDLCVSRISRTLPENNSNEIVAIEFSRPLKKELLEVLSSECTFGSRRLPILVAIGYFAASVKQFILGEIKQPIIPGL